MTGASESFVLRGGVIAAGHGTRLRADGYRVSKPMTPVGGRPLIGHALDRFRAVGVDRVTVIVNEESDDCRRWFSDQGQDFDLDVIVRTTPSSYASFELVAARLAGARAVITTVDAIMPIDTFQHFVDSAARFSNDALVLGLTDYLGTAFAPGSAVFSDANIPGLSSIPAVGPLFEQPWPFYLLAAVVGATSA